MREEEKTIPGFPDYKITKSGRVFSYKRGKRRELARVSGSGGYIQVYLYVDNAGHVKKIHRLLAETFLVPGPGETVARHLDGDINNNVLENIAWGTYKDNSADRIRHGRSGLGEKNAFSKLKLSDVLRIADRLRTSATLKSIAAEFGVSYSTIKKINTGVRWPEANGGKPINLRHGDTRKTSPA